MEFKIPDLHSPRYRPKRTDLLSKPFYKEFRGKYPEYAHYSDKELKGRIRLVNTAMWETAINERDGMELPAGLGYIFVGSCPRRTRSNVDYKTSALYKTKVQHQNLESDSYLAKIFYTNFHNKYQFKHHDLWGFRACKPFRSALAQIYPKRWKLYVMVDNLKKITNLFRRLSTKLDQDLLNQDA